MHVIRNFNPILFNKRETHQQLCYRSRHSPAPLLSYSPSSTSIVLRSVWALQTSNHLGTVFNHKNCGKVWLECGCSVVRVW